MIKRFLTLPILIVVIIVAISVKASAQGLMFLHPKNMIDKRTSYQVFTKTQPSFKNQMTIEFQMKILSRDNLGYIFRIIDNGGQKIYNLFLDLYADDDFELNDEGVRKLMVAKYPTTIIPDNKWFHVKITFHLKKKEISMYINGQRQVVSCPDLPDRIKPDIWFGRSDYLIDVPAISIKNLSVSGDSKSYLFPLDETHGNNVYDSKGDLTGHVSNPYWIINDSYHWKKLTTMNQPAPAGVSFDQRNSHIYYFSASKLLDFDLRTRNKSVRHYASPCPLKIDLGMNFFDTRDKRLFAYEVFQGYKPEQAPSVASLDLHAMTWRTESTVQLPSQRHHHGTCFDARNRRQIIFGGFGSMTYSDELVSYDINSHQWKKHHLKGNVPHRYFVSMASKGRWIYLFGGMGNSSGSQTVGRKYFYDLYRIDTLKHTIRKMWEAKWKEKENMVPVRNMIIDGKYIYTLCYSEFLSHSHLRLFRFNINDGDYQIMGDSIPIRSDQILTNANIYLDANTDRMIATVQEFKDDRRSVLNIYSINVPPISSAEFDKLSEAPKANKLWVWLTGGSLAILAAAGIVYYLLRRKKMRLLDINDLNTEVKEVHAPNTVLIFGTFAAYNRQNKDISYLFTSKLRELFCLLLSHTEDGISSHALGNLLWPDKTPEKIKNLRSVTISHLRKVLIEIDGISLVYGNNVFRLKTNASFHCDYLTLSVILNGEQNPSDEQLFELLSRGKFLQDMNQSSLDSIKSEIDNRLLPLLSSRMKAAFDAEEYKSAIRYAQIIKYYDSLDENAFKYHVKALKKIGLQMEAQEVTHLFEKEYRNIYGNSFEG